MKTQSASSKEMKTMQILGHKSTNNKLLRAAGVKRIYQGWYTVRFHGEPFDKSTVVSATRNKEGEFDDENTI